MLNKIKEHKMLIAILILLVVSNVFTIALFMNTQEKPLMRVNGNDTPETTNIIDDSPGSSWFGDVTNTQPVVESKVVKAPQKVPVYASKTYYQYYTIDMDGRQSDIYTSDKYPVVPAGNELVITKTWSEKYVSGYEYK